MPSADQPQETYSSCLEGLSEYVLQSTQSTSNAPVIIIGDLNCHLGYQGFH